MEIGHYMWNYTQRRDRINSQMDNYSVVCNLFNCSWYAYYAQNVHYFWNKKLYIGWRYRWASTTERLFWD